MKICPNCKAQCDDDKSICPSCNSFLPPTPTEQAPTTNSYTPVENTNQQPMQYQAPDIAENTQQGDYQAPVQPSETAVPPQQPQGQPNYQYSQPQQNQNYQYSQTPNQNPQYQYQQPVQNGYYQQPMQQKKKGLPGWGIALIIVGSFVLLAIIVVIILSLVFANVAKHGIDTFASEYTQSEYNYDYSYDDEEDVSSNQTQKPDDSGSKTAEIGSAFNFGDLEITVGDKYEFTKVDNEFNDNNGKDVVKIPVTIKNNGTEENHLNMFFLTEFGAKGVKLDFISLLFKDGIDVYKDLQPGASVTGYVYVLYDGNGDYTLQFNDYTSKVQVKYPIEK